MYALFELARRTLTNHAYLLGMLIQYNIDTTSNYVRLFLTECGHDIVNDKFLLHVLVIRVVVNKCFLPITTPPFSTWRISPSSSSPSSSLSFPSSSLSSPSSSFFPVPLPLPFFLLCLLHFQCCLYCPVLHGLQHSARVCLAEEAKQYCLLKVQHNYHIPQAIYILPPPSISLSSLQKLFFLS